MHFMLKLKVFIITKLLLNCEITKVIAEAENGHFCLFLHHLDFVAALVPGILRFAIDTGEELL